MALSDERKKKIADIACGENINAAISIPDQIAALREQMGLVLVANPKIEVCNKYKEFSDTVSEMKSKADEKTKSKKDK